MKVIFVNLFITHTSERTCMTVCIWLHVFLLMNPCWSSVSNAICTLLLLLSAAWEQKVDVRKTWPSTHLFYSSSRRPPLPLISALPLATEPTPSDSRSRGLAHYRIGCLCVLRWLYSPPDSIRQTAVISHMRRRWTPDSRATSQRCVLSFQETLIWSRRTRFASASCRKQNLFPCMCYKRWMTLLKLTQVGSGHPVIASPSPSHLLVWLPWWWPTPQPLIRSLFSLWARRRASASSPLLRAAKPA